MRRAQPAAAPEAPRSFCSARRGGRAAQCAPRGLLGGSVRLGIVLLGDQAAPVGHTQLPMPATPARPTGGHTSAARRPIARVVLHILPVQVLGAPGHSAAHLSWEARDIPARVSPCDDASAHGGTFPGACLDLSGGFNHYQRLCTHRYVLVLHSLRASSAVT
eukprot:scaffold95325_cov32-Tisochrysis_lutea.AAC.4